MEPEQYLCSKCRKCGDIHHQVDVAYCPAVKCIICGKLHAKDTYSFVVVSGNITQGMPSDDSIKNDTLNKARVFCVGSCFKQFINTCFGQNHAFDEEDK